MARPKLQIDWDEVGDMLVAGCDATSIARALGISTDTLYVRSKQDNKLDFSAFSQQKKAQGDDLLRRKQFEVALNGNVSMLIWLGKNRLGQSDKQEINDKRNDTLALAREVLAAAEAEGVERKKAIRLTCDRYGVLQADLVR
jgi:hypothetical protein